MRTLGAAGYISIICFICFASEFLTCKQCTALVLLSSSQFSLPKVILLLVYIYFIFTVSHRYGAPGTQLVNRKFIIDWDHYMCSTHSIIIVYVDGRGTSGRGNKWMHSIYKQLGTLEVEDTILAAR